MFVSPPVVIVFCVVVVVVYLVAGMLGLMLLDWGTGMLATFLQKLEARRRTLTRSLVYILWPLVLVAAIIFVPIEFAKYIYLEIRYGPYGEPDPADEIETSTQKPNLDIEMRVDVLPRPHRTSKYKILVGVAALLSLPVAAGLLARELRSRNLWRSR